MDRTIKMVPKIVNIIFVFFLSLVCLAVTVGVAFIVNRIMPVEERYFFFILVSILSMGTGLVLLPWIQQKLIGGNSCWIKEEGGKIDYYFSGFLGVIGLLLLSIMGKAPFTMIVLVIMQNLVVCYCEEYFTKNVIFTRLGYQWNNCYLFCLISAIVFAFLIHSADSFMINLTYRFPMGIFLAVVYEKRKNIWIPVMLHLLNNLIATSMI